MDAIRRIEETQTELRDVTASSARIAGGSAWLAEVLDHKPSYETQINDAFAGRKEAKVHTDWWAPLLDDPKAFAPLLAYLIQRGELNPEDAERIATLFSERHGFAPPVRKRVVSKEDKQRAALEVIEEADDDTREVLCRKMARRLGVRVEDVK